MAINIWLGTSSNDYAVASNWSLGAVPVATNQVIFTTGSLNSVDASLNQSTVALTSMIIDMGFQNSIGDISTYLQVACPAITIGTQLPTGQPQGSGRINLNVGTTTTTVTVFNGKNVATDLYQTPIRLLGGALTIVTNGGIVGCATNYGETSTVTSVTVDGGVVNCGAGASIGSIKVLAGVIINASTSTSAITTATVSGQYIVTGSVPHTTLTINTGGKTVYNGTGTISTLNLTGIIDFSQGLGAVTITNINRYPNGTINDPYGRVTMTNAATDLGGATQRDNGSVFGANRNWKIT